MHSPERVASRRSSKEDILQNPFMTQAGRTETSLVAEQAAVTLREQGRASPTEQSGLPEEHASNPNSRPSSPTAQAPPSPKAPSLRRPSSYAPTVSSPLNPFSPANSASNSRRASREALHDLGEPQSPFADEHATGSVPPSPKRPSAFPIPRPRPGQPMGSRDASRYRSMAPRSVTDLGQDYTRYYNPYERRHSSTPSIPRHPSTDSDVAAGIASTRSSTPMGLKSEQSAPLLPASDPEKAFMPYLDDRLTAPWAEHAGYKFPMYLDEKELDDDMHTPSPNDDIDNRAGWKERFFGKGRLAHTVGLIFIFIGLLFILVILPAMSATGGLTFTTSFDTANPAPNQKSHWRPPPDWATVNNRTYPLLKNIRTGLIDPDTPESAYNMTGVDGDELVLVFSDEFNKPNRTFYPEDDPYWFAPDIWYGATQDLEWFDPDAVTTWDGTLELRLDEFFNHNVRFRSGMLNSWNQVCFKGGRFEVSVSLPGPGGVSGLWPGAWTMGNLGRPGYLATTEGTWPYTYNECDVGITPNQSMTDGTSRLPGQRLPACTCPGEDHPTPGTGRGAPEIDILEASAWGGKPVITQSFQVAPFDDLYYPNYDFTELPNPPISMVNTYTGGPFQQAVSTTTMLNHTWYDGIEYQRYAFEYTPGTTEGEINWLVADDLMFKMNGKAIGPNGNIGQRVVSEEPMSMILNLGFSNAWVGIDWANLKFPTIMRVDYVRWYQKAGNHSETVTCDPPGYETTEYIKNHPNAYNNPNLTLWDQTGFPWPKHKLNSDC